MYSRLCLALLLISTLPVLLSACHWNEDLLVKVKDIKNKEYSTTINGCIQRTSFDGKVVELYISNQTIGILGEGSVKNLVDLKTLVLKGCKIDSISPGAFKNLPKIRTLELSYGNIKEIPSNVLSALPSIDVLRIDHNEIDLIESQAFARLSSLTAIYAHNNKLEYWNREWFANNMALVTISFMFNRIRSIPRRAFANLPNLREVLFQYNEISVIQPDAFQGLTNLEYLGLRHNRLTELREDMFPNRLRIQSFLIDANYLNFLPEALLQKISVGEIIIDNNPWKCPCLDRIHFWLNRMNVTKRIDDWCLGANIPVCAVSKTFSRTCLETVDPDLTERYIKSVKEIKPSIPKLCARID